MALAAAVVVLVVGVGVVCTGPLRAARRLDIPVVVVAAGGYQKASAIATLNVATARCALHVQANDRATRGRD